jgi:ABC-type nitrate/sulfonate/bicarbonate transport system permease component
MERTTMATDPVNSGGGAEAAKQQAAAPPARRRIAPLRADIPFWQVLLLGGLCLVVCGTTWWALTRGKDDEDRILSPVTIASPAETFATFPSLWFERELSLNTVATLRRVALGFGLAALVGVPLGVLCGCFPRVRAFFSPLAVVGRNIPVAALVPLSFSLFGIDEFQKIMFIFVACVAFIVTDTARAVGDVSDRYIDTAYTLGASQWQIILKVLMPLAMPSIFNSLRLLFGIAFGYIMLAEVIQTDTAGGLGSIINNSQRLGPREHILLVLMIIPIVALLIDRLLFWIQRQLFPYQYGGNGALHHGLRAVLRVCEDVKLLIVRPAEWKPADMGAGRDPANKATWKP